MATPTGPTRIDLLVFHRLLGHIFNDDYQFQTVTLYAVGELLHWRKSKRRINVRRTGLVACLLCVRSRDRFRAILFLSSLKAGGFLAPESKRVEGSKGSAKLTARYV